MVNEEMYGETLALMIRQHGRVAWEIADRWMLGWPDRVQALLTSGTLLECMIDQVDKEVDVLIDVPENEKHLAAHERLKLAGIPPYPPVIDRNSLGLHS